MANEAVLRDRLSTPIDFTCADGTAIAKGAICKLTDPRTASLSDGTGDVLAGIAARDKVASDGRTQISIFRHVIVDLKASGAITAGTAVISAGATEANTIKAVGTGALAYSGAAILGYALETASDAETIQVLVNVGASCG